MKKLFCLLVLAVSSVAADAQGFKPARTVEVVVHTGPGASNDVLARAVAMRESPHYLCQRLER